jgi:sarcosine oxidase subunit gamma
MAEASSRRSPLAHLARTRIADDGGRRIRIELLTRLAYLHLRLPAGDESTIAAVQAALGGSLPRTANALSLLRTGIACRLGPDEWLAEVAGTGASLLLRAIEERVRDRFASVTDVTDARAAFAVAGSAAADLLRKGCPLDLHRAVFPERSCARTMLAKANIVLICHAPDSKYSIVADRSEADYVWRWLEDAAFEFTRNHPAHTPPTTQEETR